MFILAWCRLFLLFLGILILPHTVHCDGETEDESDHPVGMGKEYYELMLITKETLEFGASCNPSDKASITEAEIEVNEKSPKSGDSEVENATDLYIETIKKFLETRRKLCNRNNLLSCDKDTQKCACGPKDAYGHEFKYIQESNKQCRWAEGFTCLSDDEVKERMPHNPGCASNTKCLIVNKKNENLPCNDANMENEKKHAKTVECSCMRFNNNTNNAKARKNSASSTIQTSIQLLMIISFAYASSLHVLSI